MNYRTIPFLVSLCFLCLSSTAEAKILNPEMLADVHKVILSNGNKVTMCQKPADAKGLPARPETGLTVIDAADSAPLPPDVPIPQFDPTNPPPTIIGNDHTPPPSPSGLPTTDQTDCVGTQKMILADLTYEFNSGKKLTSMDDHLILFDGNIYRMDSVAYSYYPNKSLKTMSANDLLLVDATLPEGQRKINGFLDVTYSEDGTVKSSSLQIKNTNYLGTENLQHIDDLTLLELSEPSPIPSPTMTTVSGESIIDPATATPTEKFQLLLRDKCAETKTMDSQLLPITLSDSVKKLYSITNTVSCYFPEMNSGDTNSTYIHGSVSLSNSTNTRSLSIGTSMSQIGYVQSWLDEKALTPTITVDGFPIYISIYGGDPYPITNLYTTIETTSQKKVNHLIVMATNIRHVEKDAEVKLLLQKHNNSELAKSLAAENSKISLAVDDYDAFRKEFLDTYVKPYPNVPTYIKEMIDEVVMEMKGVTLK